MAGPPTTTRLVLVRHGQVELSWAQRIYGDLDVPLSTAGEAEALAVARRLRDRPFAAVVSSGLSRTEFGAAALRAERDLPRRDEPRLAELHRGEWRGRTLEEIEARWPGAWSRWWRAPDRERPPGGESVTDLAARVLPVLDELAHEHPGAEVAVVAHSWVNRLAATHALGLPVGAVTRFELPTAGVVAVDWPLRVAGAPARPILAAFHESELPDPGSGWFRGPRR